MKKLTESAKRGSKIAACSQVQSRSRRIRKRSVIPTRNSISAAASARKELNRMDGVLTLRLPALLRLSRDQVKALRLIIAWEGKTLTEYIRYALIPTMRSSLEDMGGFARQQHGYRTTDIRKNKQEQAWAKKFHKELEPLMAGKEAEYAG